MNFRLWLESQRDIRFARFDNHGMIELHIDGKMYIFSTSPGLHNKWKWMLRKNYPGARWDVLNQIKKNGRQIYPPPVASVTLIKTPPQKQLPAQLKLF